MNGRDLGVVAIAMHQQFPQGLLLHQFDSGAWLHFSSGLQPTALSEAFVAAQAGHMLPQSYVAHYSTPGHYRFASIQSGLSMPAARLLHPGTQISAPHSLSSGRSSLLRGCDLTCGSAAMLASVSGGASTSMSHRHTTRCVDAIPESVLAQLLEFCFISPSVFQLASASRRWRCLCHTPSLWRRARVVLPCCCRRVCTNIMLRCAMQHLDTPMDSSYASCLHMDIASELRPLGKHVEPDMGLCFWADPLRRLPCTSVRVVISPSVLDMYSLVFMFSTTPSLHDTGYAYLCGSWPQHASTQKLTYVDLELKQNGPHIARTQVANIGTGVHQLPTCDASYCATHGGCAGAHLLGSVRQYMPGTAAGRLRAATNDRELSLCIRRTQQR